MLPTWCHFLSDSDYAHTTVSLKGSRMMKKMLRISMKIQFRGVFGKTLGSGPDRTFCTVDLKF